MILRIEHETRLDYSEPVIEHVFELRMAPSSDEDQTTLGCRIQVTPSGTSTTYLDGFGNRVELLNIMSSGKSVVVRATSFVRTHRRPALDRFGDTLTTAMVESAQTHVDAIEFLQSSPLLRPCPALDTILAECAAPMDGLVLNTITHIREFVHKSMRYSKDTTNAATGLSEIVEHRSGVCQDFAHLMIAMCRKLGIPARYVSGYAHQVGNQAAEVATHAWCQVWIGANEGWVDVDPTHNLFPQDHHVVTAVGRDYSDVPPNRGAWKGEADETMTVMVKVETAARLPADWIVADTMPSRSTPVRPYSPFRINPGVRRAIGLAQQQRNLLRQQQQQQQQ
jgi:transglutaminase-like putative cysteine protease